MLVHLTAQIMTIELAGEGPAQHFRQPRHRGEDHGRVTMEKDESRIGIDLADRLQGEEVVRTFQDPAARALLALQMLEEALVESIGRPMTGAIEPTAIAGHAMRRVEAKALEDMRRDLG